MDYGSIRYFLFTQSYACHKLLNYLRQLYGIASPPHDSDWYDKIKTDYQDELTKSIFYSLFKNAQASNDQQEEMLALNFLIDDVSRKITPEIAMISQAIDVDEMLFRILVLYGNVPKKLSGRSLVHNVIIKSEPIEEVGHYIKVDEYTSKQEVLAAYDEIQGYQKISKHVHPHKEQKKAWQIVNKRKRKEVSKSNDLVKLSLYLQVEESMILLDKEKTRGDDLSYNKSLVWGAIERIVGDNINNRHPNINDIDFDAKLEDEKNYVNNIYRKIVSRYGLPTAGKLPQLLRLISK